MPCSTLLLSVLLGGQVTLSQTPQLADGRLCKGTDGHFMQNDNLAAVYNEVSEAASKEMYNSVAWVCKHSTV